MELSRRRYTARSSIKFNLLCSEQIEEGANTDAWLTLSKVIAGNAAVLQAALKSRSKAKQVVVKFGDRDSLKDEYDAGHALFSNALPNFIKFICYFTCNDDFGRVLQQNYNTRPYICSGKGDGLGNGLGNGLGCLVMPYYPLGSLDTYAWKRQQLSVFKNVITQVCWALCYAYATTGFVHGDLHAGNVLLRNTTKQELSYGSNTLVLNGMFALIMDLERSKKDDDAIFAHTLQRCIYTACTADGSDLVLDFDTNQISMWQERHPKLDSAAFNDIARIIEAIPLRYVKSERPPNPFTGR